MSVTPPRLGTRELQILKVMTSKNYKGVAYWEIINEICGCRGGAECKREGREACRVSVTRALSRLRKKKILYKKRYAGEVNYYLTREGKKLLLDLAGNL